MILILVWLKDWKKCRRGKMLHGFPACLSFECLILQWKSRITQSRVVAGFLNILSHTHANLFMLMFNLYFSEVCFHSKSTASTYLPQVTQAKEIQTASKVVHSTGAPELIKLLLLEHTHCNPFPFWFIQGTLSFFSNPFQSVLVSRLKELSWLTNINRSL